MRSAETRLRRSDDQLLRLLSFGVFLLILGIIVLATPNLSDQISAFVQDLKLEQIQSGVNASLPAPQGPHPQLYGAAALFGLAFGVYLVLLLIAKFVLGADFNQKAETLTGVIFWLGIGLAMLALARETIAWLLFVAIAVVLIAIIILVRSAAFLISKKRPGSH